VEREIELCTLNIVDIPIISLQDAGMPFKIKVSTIRMTIARAECIRAGFLEWHIDLLKRWMEKMEMEKRSSTPKGRRGKIHMRGVHRDEDARRKWDNLPGARWVTKKNIRDNSKVPRRRRLLKLIRERWRITLGDHEDHDRTNGV
jgi:hypothetical protein